MAFRREIVERNPWVAVNLFKAFDEARRRSVERALNNTSSTLPLPWGYEFARRMQDVVGKDLMPYGVDANRTTLDAFLQYGYEQGVFHRRMTPEELFPPQVQKSVAGAKRGVRVAASRRATRMSVRLLAQRVDAGLGDLLVLVRLHAGYADRADALALVHQRQAALEHARRGVGKVTNAGRSLTRSSKNLVGRLVSAEVRALPIATSAAIAPVPSRRSSRMRSAAVVDDGDGHVPFVLLRFGLAGGHHLLRVGESETWLVTHGVSFADDYWQSG